MTQTCCYCDGDGFGVTFDNERMECEGCQGYGELQDCRECGTPVLVVEDYCTECLHHEAMRSEHV